MVAPVDCFSRRFLLDDALPVGALVVVVGAGSSWLMVDCVTANGFSISSIIPWWVYCYIGVVAAQVDDKDSLDLLLVFSSTSPAMEFSS